MWQRDQEAVIRMIISWLIYLSPIAVCIVSGLLYGYSFLLQQQSWVSGGYSLRGRLVQISFFISRIVILFGMAKYLLRSEVIPSILGVIVFIALFWLVILRVKVSYNERNWHRRD